MTLYRSINDNAGTVVRVARAPGTDSGRTR
jgi:hypothetical protein